MRLLQILVLVFSLISFVDAQKRENLTTLSGTVYDKNGAVILETIIRAADKNGKEYITKPDDNGVYKIELPMEIYSIEFKANGYKALKVEPYRVIQTQSKKMFFDVVLEVRVL